MLVDYLRDIVSHTNGLGVIDLCKITGTDKETSLDAISEDRSVIVQAKFNKSVKEFEGVFGMPNLSRLNTILNIPEYKENAKLNLVSQNKNGTTVLTGLHFENKAADFKNEYRFMVSELITEKLKSAKFNAPAWAIDFVPTVANIQRLKFQAAAHNDETTFVAKTDGKDLKFYFGDHSSHAGEFIFQPNVTGKLNRAWAYPVAVVIGILGLPGDKTMKFSDAGAALIAVDSGLIKYNYILPAMTK